jgi:uncharacterized phage-associated protein
MPHSSLAIANEFLKMAQNVGKALTHLHVQKLVYIAHGFHLALYDEPLVDEQFQAWDFGPVAPELYWALKRYGSRTVTRLIRRGDATPWGSPWGSSWGESWSDTGSTGGGDRAIAEDLTPPEAVVIDQVWRDFREYEGFQLSALTHGPHSPWERVYKMGMTEPIPNNSIKDYFSQYVDAPDVAEG